MTIEYQNINGVLLSSQQLLIADSYVKVFKDNGLLVKEEFYYEGLLTSTIFYLVFGESHADLLSQNIEKLNITEIEIVDSNYTRYHEYGYFNNIMEEKSVSVLNSQDKCIFYSKYDIVLNLPINHATNKYYQDYLSGTEFEFAYNSSGSLVWILVENYDKNYHQEFRASELESIPYFNWWDDYSSYYENAVPDVPSNLIIV